MEEDIISKLIAKDNVFQVILDTYGMPLGYTRPEGFETLCRIILEQQVSLSSATATYNRIKDLVRDITPDSILECTDAEMKRCGVSRQKTSYLRALAEAIVDGDIDLKSFAHKSAEQVRQELIKIKGVGNWTIDVYLLLSLKSPDVLPLGDIGVVSVIKELWGIQDIENMRLYTKIWAPYRTTATFLLWHYYLAKRHRDFPD